MFSVQKPQSGDIWGGLAASAVVLPQAMAFGVAFLSAAGVDASQGAIAGLIGAAIVCTISGLGGGTQGLISAPTGPLLVLLGGVLMSLNKAGVAGDALLTNLAMVILVTGALQILIGITGGGKLIKYIPYPVVSGFLTGSAILMIMSQIGPLSGSGTDDTWEQWRWLPALTALVTVVSTYFVPRFVRWLPGTIAGLFIGTFTFHLIALFNPADIPGAWMIGTLPGIESVSIGIDLNSVAEVQWQIVVPAALALATLVSLDTLLTAVIADVTTGLRHRANREMVAQGLGQILAGLMGGMAAAGTTGATVVSIKSGGRRWAGVFAGVTFLLLIIAAGDVGRLLPISVLAGIILSVSLRMLDTDIIAWFKRKRSRQDAIIAMIVTVVTVAWDLMIAVGIGVLIAVFLFIRTQIRSSVIHRRSNGTQVHSVQKRNAAERESLNNHGQRIILYELRGNLFFATADALLEELTPDLDGPNWVILHMRRVLQIDLTAIKLLQQIALRLQKNGGTLIFCNVHKGIGLGKKVQKIMRKVTASGVEVPVLTFNGKDEALEHAEDLLLAELGVKLTEFDDVVALADNDLCQALSEEELAFLSTVLRTRELERKEVLFSAGDTGDEIFLVGSGEVDIRLPTTKHHYKRLATCRAGSFFGELAMLKPGPRVASAVAAHKTRLYSLDREGLDQLRSASPDTAVRLLMKLAEIQVEHLRWSALEVRRLSEW